MTHQQAEAVFEFLESVNKLILRRGFGFSCEKILYKTETHNKLSETLIMCAIIKIKWKMWVKIPRCVMFLEQIQICSRWCRYNIVLIESMSLFSTQEEWILLTACNTTLSHQLTVLGTDNKPTSTDKSALQYALYRLFTSVVFWGITLRNSHYFNKHSGLIFPICGLIPSALFFWLFFFFLLLWSRIIWASADCCSFPMNASISSKQWLSTS